MSTEVSIIIVSWNCRQMLADCIKSLQGQLPEGCSEIIVVDNASSDGTADAIRANFPTATFIESKTNQGFARGNNTGIEVSKGKYLCLVNPDVVVGTRCLAQLFEYMEQNPGVGMVGPKIIGRDGRTQRSCMRTPTLWNQLCRTFGLDTLTKSSRLFGGYLMKDFHFDELREVEIINGCFWMIRRAALESVGNLDQRFWMYGEDLDWCRRFQLCVWKLVFFPDAKAVHYGGISSEQASVRCYVEMQRANLQYWRKYHSVLSCACYFVLLCAAHALRSCIFACAFVLNTSSRTRALMRLQKHLACIRWLMGWTWLGKEASA
jgi:GT2 family glycosyltransferase